MGIFILWFGWPGFFTYCRNALLGTSAGIGFIDIVVCMYIGLNWHTIYLSCTTWMMVVGLHIAIASVTPMWILLRPRDYLSPFPRIGVPVI